MGFGILASQAPPGWAAATQKLERGGGGMTATASGELTVPEVPGLGVDVDPTFLKKLKKI